MYSLLRSVQRHTGVTVLHVTHNWAETRMLADRVLLLREGAIAEDASSVKSDDRVQLLKDAENASSVKSE